MRDFTKYDIWHDAVDFVTELYQRTTNLPVEEKYGLTSQLRRASVSISSNFAEGCSRSSEKEFCRFVEVSLGSVFEAKTQLILANKLKMMNGEHTENLISALDKIARQLNALRNKLKD